MDLIPEYIKNSYNSTIKRQKTKSKIGKRFEKNISPKKIYISMTNKYMIRCSNH